MTATEVVSSVRAMFPAFAPLRALPPKRGQNAFQCQALHLAAVPAIGTTSPHPGFMASVQTRPGCCMLMHARQAGLYARHLSHRDRKSTRLNSSHVRISYAVF